LVYIPSSSKFCPWVIGLKIRKYGAASAPLPAIHCQPAVLLALSASTRQLLNQACP